MFFTKLLFCLDCAKVCFSLSSSNDPAVTFRRNCAIAGAAVIGIIVAGPAFVNSSPCPTGGGGPRAAGGICRCQSHLLKSLIYCLIRTLASAWPAGSRLSC